MIALIQRVTNAGVQIGGESVATIAAGLLVLIGIQPADDAAHARRLLERVLDYRVFADAQGRMNRSLRETGGGLLLVPQFTLAADTLSGNRASFTTAAAPDQARALYELLLNEARSAHAQVASGVFGADMQVTLTNDGPVTFWLEA